MYVQYCHIVDEEKKRTEQGLLSPLNGGSVSKQQGLGRVSTHIVKHSLCK